jgi:hypothetical protein
MKSLGRAMKSLGRAMKSLGRAIILARIEEKKHVRRLRLVCKM